MAKKIKYGSDLERFEQYDLKDFQLFQGDLKLLTDRNYSKLKNQLERDGLLTPFILWENPKDNKIYIMDGHQRYHIFTSEGYGNEKVPAFFILADNEIEAKKKLLQINSDYGRITEEGFDKFIFDIGDDWIKQNIQIDGLHFARFSPDFNSDKIAFGDEVDENDDSGKGTSKKTPTASYDGYATMEFILTIENKNSVVSKINKIKEQRNLQKNEDALMYIINNFNK